MLAKSMAIKKKIRINLNGKLTISDSYFFKGNWQRRKLEY